MHFIGLSYDVNFAMCFCIADPDFCDPNPCRHYGTCVQTHLGHHECHCTPHYKGHFCECKHAIFFLANRDCRKIS